MEDFIGFKNIVLPWTLEDDNNLKKLYNIDKLDIDKISKIVNKPECYIISKLIKLNIIEYRDDCRGYKKYKISDDYNDNIDSERLFYIRQNKYLSKNKLLDEDVIIKEESLVDKLKRLRDIVKELKYNLYDTNYYIYDKDIAYEYSESFNIYLDSIEKTDKIIFRIKKLKNIL